MAHFPAGSSRKTVLHYKQLMVKKQFEHFDYGKDKNRERYGQEEPPAIPLVNIQDFPVALFAGSEDKLAHISDVRWLKELLERQKSLCFYEEYKFGHLSFLLPNNLKHFQDIVSLIQRYNPTYVPSEEGLKRRKTVVV
jgi:lysosomal acid lipase/cholesteryl ester hydrolase